MSKLLSVEFRNVDGLITSRVPKPTNVILLVMSDTVLGLEHITENKYRVHFKKDIVYFTYQDATTTITPDTLALIQSFGEIVVQ